jgi:hypothetical protein
MKGWWTKLTIDWPCALGDWLWAMLVVEPVRLMDKITRRRVLQFIGFLLLLLFYRQVVMLDLTFLFGVDLGLLMEVAAAIFILAVRNGGKAPVAVTRQCLVSARTRVTHALRRGARRVRHAVRRLIPPAEEDDLAVGLCP